MYIPPRKERKAIAKKLGAKKKKESFKEMVERFRRAQEFGKMLHLQHLQNQENNKVDIEEKIEKYPEKNTNVSEGLDWEKEELKKIVSGETQ